MKLREELLKYSSTRIFMFIFALTTGLIWFDVFHLPFWMYALIKTPIDFTLNFMLSRWVFKKDGNK